MDDAGKGPEQGSGDEPQSLPAPDLGKSIPESVFADDDGSADPLLAQALIRFANGRAPLSEVVEALAYARVLVPVMASGDQRHVGRHGLEQDEVASTGVVAVELPDGRSALPIFTDVESMSVWNPAARPIPAEGPRAALAAVAEDWSVLLLNPGRETVAIPRPAVWALGRGETWKPVVVAGEVDPAVREAISQGVSLDDHVREVDAVPGSGAEIAVVLRLAAGLTRDELALVIARVQDQLAGLEVMADRVDSVELKVLQA